MTSVSNISQTDPYELGLVLRTVRGSGQLHAITVSLARVLNAVRRLGHGIYGAEDAETLRAAAVQWLQLLGFIDAAVRQGVDDAWVLELRKSGTGPIFIDLLHWGAGIFSPDSQVTRPAEVTDEHVAIANECAMWLEAHALQPVAAA